MEIGWIGTGIMGSFMCEHVMNGGYKINVFNRTKKKAENLILKGAKWCKTPKKVAELSDVIFTMLGTPEDVDKVILGSNGLLVGALSQSTIIDMTTSSPTLAKDVYKKAKNRGIFFLDAPVSGGENGAKDGVLAVMVGGDRNVYQKNLHLLNLFGSNIEYMGSSGAGQHSKMSNQILIAGTMIGVVESLLYAKKNGIDLNDLIKIVSKGAASSWSITVLGKKIIYKDYNPGFIIKHFVKDMEIILEEAKRTSLHLPGLSMVKNFYIEAMDMGYEELGIQALYKVLERLNRTI